jgi:hypothetical protein
MLVAIHLWNWKAAVTQSLGPSCESSRYRQR